MRSLAARQPAWLGLRCDADFAARASRPPPLAWALLALGVLALAGAAAMLAPRLSERGRLSSERLELQQRIVQQQGRPVGGHAASVADISEARALLAELGRPWGPLFDRFESVDVPKVYLVQLAVDSHFQTAQMVAEASRLEDMLLYSRSLEGNGPIRSIRLTHHEWRAAPGARVIVGDLAAELTGADGDNEEAAR